MRLLSKLTATISIIDTMALGEPRVVAAYLISGKKRALVDMGYPTSAAAIIRDLETAGIDDIDYLLPTHVHLDHGGSCGTLAKKFPRALVRVHPSGTNHLVDPARLIEGAGELFGGELMQLFGFPEPISAERVHGLKDDEIIDLENGLTLRTVWTPGHASHHLSFLLEPSRVFFTGDCIGAYFPDVSVLVPTTPPPSFNLDKALASIAKVRTLKPAEFCTPHFGVLRKPETWLDKNQQKLLEWKKTIMQLLSQGNSIESITDHLTLQISNQLHRPPSQLPVHFRTLIRLSTIGFVRWLQYSQMSG
jgi:glyoxylase-like metal-dependent hydrolase (beta-lactamase superfamily II)